VRRAEQQRGNKNKNKNKKNLVSNLWN
jgi:hypothetical protein